MLVELARIRRAEQRLVEDGDLFHAAHGALEAEALALAKFSLPAALGLLGKRVEAVARCISAARPPSRDRRRSPT